MAAGPTSGPSGSFASFDDMNFAPINSHHYSNPTPPESVMDEGSPAPTGFINPQDISNDGQFDMSGMSSRATSVSPSGGYAAEDDGSEPPKKKRKSWGQVLPKPTTNLPPRKRAKTDVSNLPRLCPPNPESYH